MVHEHEMHGKSQHGRPYLLFWVSMTVGLAVMYIVMFTLINGFGDFRNNLNMFYMALTMGIFMLVTMPGMYPNRRLDLAMLVLFVLVTVASFGATRVQALVDYGQFIAAMIPHHSGAILMCREASLSDVELVALCDRIMQIQRDEIDQMERIAERLR